MKPTITLSPFPREVESWWWTHAVERWPDMSEEKLLNLLRQEIVEQSDRFNKDRSFDPSAYGARDLSILAYGNFYFSRTWMAARFALAELLTACPWTPPAKGPIRILDLGSGSGASGLACLNTLREHGIANPLELHAFDYSSKSLAYLKDLHRSCADLWPNTRIKTERNDLRNPSAKMVSQRYDLVLMGFSFNEIMQDLELDEQVQALREITNCLKRSGYFVLTEPAEAEICRSLQQTVARLNESEQDLYIAAPYWNGMPCPMVQENSRYFSHEVRKYPAVGTVERLNRPLRLEIREVKFGFSILGQTKNETVAESPNFLRLISPIKKRKGTISFFGMAANGMEQFYEFQRRNLSKETINELLGLQRGDLIQVEGVLTVSEDGRIRLTEANRLIPLFAPRVGVDA